ncbi:efflux RND transporter permease subunit [Albidovulum sediminicola]|uniref:Efflux RND transporter permease subunit n=1 Tax=Albidovulum sediminicola TaxID=2984331 RepID=A0ABT2YYJ1_9RHOB|nr:efflux RND transporter permease subunit [Defluviimonas sp. WL0075]MCV2863913.1 efflux RND transporter permease subunit [Defluviimonas sp. WL0075]
MARRGEGLAGGILSYFTRHATAANLVLVCVMMAGLAAIPKMRTQYFPDVVVPEVDVTVAWPGAGAADADRGIVELMEPALRAVEGVEHASSVASEGRASIELAFEPGWDIARGLSDVEAAVAAITTLPEEAETPEVRRGSWRDRVTDVVISGPVAVEQLGRFADEFVAQLFAAGITRATVQGLADPEITVEVPMASLLRHDLTLEEIARTIAAEAATRPAGEIEGANTRLRTGTERRAPDALAAIVLRGAADGTTLRLGDVARIVEQPADRSRAYFAGTNPAVVIRVDRSAAGDAIGIQAAVETVAEALRPTLPQGVTVDLVRTRSADISARLSILVGNGAMGLGLVLVFLFLFLHARTAFWVAAGIPAAMLAAVAFMYAAGLTLNMISLFALILTLGIVVDDAIVVGEHADYRARRLGEPPLVAAETAVTRMAAPVFSSTITTVIAFLGLTAISGTFGRLIGDIPLTVTAVLAASLLEAFLILPNHMANALAHVGEGRWYDWPSRQVNRGFGWLRDRAVRPLIRAALAMRYAVLAGAIALLAFEVGLFLRGDIPWRFFNSPERGAVSGNFSMLPDARRDDTLAFAYALEEATEKVARDYEAKYGAYPVRHVLAEVGASSGRYFGANETRDPDLLGGISIELIDADLRPWSSFQFLADLQEAAPAHPLLEELSFRGARFGPAADALTVELSGASAEVLKTAAEALKARLARYPEVSALEDSLPHDKDELVLDLTPQGQALGFRTEDVGRELRARLSGIEAATFPSGARSAAIRVEMPKADLRADFLDHTLLRAPGGAYVPLADIVTVSVKGGFSSIRREDGRAVVSVTGDLADDNPAQAAAFLDEVRDSLLPELAQEYDIGFKLTGLSEDEGRFLSDALLGLAAALAGIYAVLAWIFASWWRPIVVMAVIPFGLIGALHGHWTWDVPLSMFSVVGMIGMAGIIVNDAIVLVVAVDEGARTRALGPAIVEAVAGRLRAVFLTTATTVAGLAPLLYETSKQAQFLKPTVITLCYGLGFGMVLVLVVVPVFLAIQADIAGQVRAFRRALRAGQRSGRLRLLLAALAAAAGAAVVALVAITGANPGPLALGIALAALVLAAGLATALAARGRGKS